MKHKNLMEKVGRLLAGGWDDLSEIMTIFERLGKTVDYDLIIQYVQMRRLPVNSLLTTTCLTSIGRIIALKIF